MKSKTTIFARCLRYNFKGMLGTAASIGLAFSAAQASAATLTWDADAVFDGTFGGTGTWNLTTANWSNASADQAWTDTTGASDIATFTGTAATVTLGTNLGALGLIFNTAPYTIATGTNTLKLGASGIDASALSTDTTTISGLVALVAGQSWNVGSSATLTTSAAVNNGGFGLTINGAGSTTLSGAITGTGALVKSGAGTLTLSNIGNTFSGGTTISAGLISIADNRALGGTGGTAGAVSLNGGTLRTTAGITNTHAITVGASGGTLNVTTTGQYFFNTTNTLLGSGALTVTGNGTLTANTGNLRIGQTNSYSGAVTLNSGGIFEHGVANAVAGGATFTIGDQGELAVNNGLTFPNNITVSGGTNSVLSFENGTTGIVSGGITLNANAIIGLRDWYNYTTVRGGTISGNITGAGSLTVNSGTGSGGTLTLSGTNTYSGGTTITTSTTRFAKLVSMPSSGTVFATAPVAGGSGATVAVNAGGAGEWTNGTSGAGTIGGLFEGIGGQGNTVALNTGSAVGIDTTNAGGSLTYSANITNAGVGLTKLGTGTMVLTGTNTYAGATTIGGGTLEFPAPTAMSSTSALTIGTGGTLSLLADANTTFTPASVTGAPGSYTVAINQLTGAGAGKTFTLANSFTAGASGSNLTVSSASGDSLLLSSQFNMFNASGPASTINLSGVDMTLNAGVNYNGATNGPLLTVNANSNTLVINGTYTTGNNRWAGIQLNNGTLTLANAQNGGSSTNNGLYAIINGGTLNLNNANAIGGAVAGNNFTIAGGTLDNTSGSTKTLTRNPVVKINGDFAFSTSGGTSANDLGIGTGTVSLGTTVGTTRTITTNGSATLTIGGVISNGTTANSLTKAGTGKLALSGVNTFTGATAVNGGTLVLTSAGSIATSTSLSVAAGAVLDASAKASFAPSATQPVTIGINGAGFGTSGRITAAGLDISTASVSFTTTGTLDDAAYVIASYTGLTGAAFASVTGLPSGYSINYSYNGGTQIALVQSSGYSAWATANAPGQTIDQDHDNDGVPNGVEYFMGQSGSTFTSNPAPVNGVVTWPMGATYTGVYGTDYEVQYSTDLVTWTQVPVGTGDNTVAINPGPTPARSVVYDMPTGGKSFVRLVVKH